ncbi:MAG: putative porin [Flavobacteriaceae bacterium]
MNKLVFILFFFLIGNTVFSQDRSSLKKRKQLSSNVNSNRLDMDSLSSRSSKQAVKNDKAKIQDYLIITQKNDTIQVDTILSIYKDYKFNYLQRDDFELLPFSNMGQTYNTLSHDFKSSSLIPGIGASAKHFNYMDVNDINYYRVPTPFTELMYKTAFEQGHVLDAFFTVNISNQFNFSIAYKGMRSLGKYQHILSSTGNFRFTTNYNSKNNRYKLRTHLVKQDILNQENGGISDEDLIGFESGDPEFIDRSLFDPIFENAQNNLEGKRFHMGQSYVLFQRDSLNSNQISIGNLLTFEDKYYHFTQDSNDPFFGDAFVSSSISDKSTFENFYTEFNARYLNKTLGAFKASLGYNNYNYGYNSLVILNNQTITNRLLGDVLSFGAAYKNKIGALDINGEVGFNITGDLEGNFINGDISYMFNDDIEAKAGININSKAPDFNFQLFQSDYLSYNWQNNFRNQQTKQLAIALKSKKYGSLQLDYNTIGNYLYFAKNEGASVKPFQHDGTLNYIRVKFSNEISYKKFALNNTILFQNVFDGDEVLNVPQLVTRHSFYYTNEFFKKALFLQTGLTFSYFSSYSMNAYDPLLAEFYTQNTTEIGDFPRIDFFINAKISQARIYLKAEHLNSSFTGYDYYSAPNYPYRDFTVRFGIVWNFFL